MKTCTVTGHRPQNLPFGFHEHDERYIRLRQLIEEKIVSMIEDENVTNFYSGMSLGVDMWAAETILNLREEYCISLTCVLPCEGQDRKWNAKFVDRYDDLLRRSDDVILLQHDYTDDCMEKRSQFMVDHSDILLAVWDGLPSGTENTVKYAIKKHKKTITLNPFRERWRILNNG